MYEHVKADVHLASISGRHRPVRLPRRRATRPGPVHRGEIQRPGARHGHRRGRRGGAPRCRRARRASWSAATPFPSMPLGFWGDDDGSRYRAAYFERYPRRVAPGRLRPVDRARRPGDLRALRRHPQPRRRAHRHGRDLPPGRAGPRGGRGHRRRPGPRRRHPHRAVRRPRGRAQALDDDLRDRIRRRIRENTTPRHVPARIVAVPEIPRTRSGKITELAVPGRDPRRARSATSRRWPTPRPSTTTGTCPSSPTERRRRRRGRSGQRMLEDSRSRHSAAV